MDNTSNSLGDGNLSPLLHSQEEEKNTFRSAVQWHKKQLRSLHILLFFFFFFHFLNLGRREGGGRYLVNGVPFFLKKIKIYPCSLVETLHATYFVSMCCFARLTSLYVRVCVLRVFIQFHITAAIRSPTI